jgi:hypothetical protein
MKLPKDSCTLDPDYSKSTLEVYRDSVEAALVNFEKADVLLYITVEEEPSWIPRWNIPMLFRNHSDLSSLCRGSPLTTRNQRGA